jgi:uncharacterized protein YybS (DUF2232 family)
MRPTAIIASTVIIFFTLITTMRLIGLELNFRLETIPELNSWRESETKPGCKMNANQRLRLASAVKCVAPVRKS